MVAVQSKITKCRETTMVQELEPGLLLILQIPIRDMIRSKTLSDASYSQLELLVEICLSSVS